MKGRTNVTSDLLADNMAARIKQLEARIAVLERRITAQVEMVQGLGDMVAIPMAERDDDGNPVGYWTIEVEIINGLPTLVGTWRDSLEGVRRAVRQ